LALLDDPKRWFDVVFLDVQMPEWGGSKFCAACEKSGRFTIGRGGHVHRQQRPGHDHEAIGLGVRHYNVKPCTEAVVTEKLSRSI